MHQKVHGQKLWTCARFITGGNPQKCLNKMASIKQSFEQLFSFHNEDIAATKMILLVPVDRAARRFLTVVQSLEMHASGVWLKVLFICDSAH